MKQCTNFFAIAGLALLFFCSMALSQSKNVKAGHGKLGAPPSIEKYRSVLEAAMFKGTTGTVSDLFAEVKKKRGLKLGTPEKPTLYTKPDYSEPLFADIVGIWNNIHAKGFEGYSYTCPSPGREWPVYALGAFYARYGGYAHDTSALIKITKMLESQQYKPEYSLGDISAPAGVFGYPIFAYMDSCESSALFNEHIALIVQQFPASTVLYRYGLYAGQKFLIADTKPEDGYFDGSLGYDHGWASMMMLESSLHLMESGLRELSKKSAMLAGKWAIEEPPVLNHSYTAKLIWYLAALYNLTGDQKIRAGFMNKLEKNLLPGVLMDDNFDGLIDDIPNISFSKLHPIAQQPGRMWDGKNSRASLMAINTLAVIEAYCALRDRESKLKDSLKLAERLLLKKFALTMCNNLAAEINTLGVPDLQSPDFFHIPFTLLTAIWKIAHVEGGQHSDWSQAANALWNAGIGKQFGQHTVNVGLMLLVKAGKKYVPPFQREQQLANMTKSNPTILSLDQNKPNPFNSTTSISFKMSVSGTVTLKILSATGIEIATLLKNDWMAPGSYHVDYTPQDLPSGVYAYRITVGDWTDTKFMQFIKSR